MPSGLGRGLGSLIPQNNTIKLSSNKGEVGVKIQQSDEKDGLLKIDPNKIKVNPMQPRQRFNDEQLDELVASIKEYGIIQPLIVTKKKKGEYELIAGERRLRSSKIAGLKEVPVVLRDANEQEKLEVALIENIQREDLNSIETAIAYKKLIDEFSLTQEQVAKKVGKSRPVVANTIRMLNLPEEIQLAVINEKISDGHARYLSGLDSEVKQMSLYRKILHNNLTVSETDKEIKKIGGTKKARVNINYADKENEFIFREFFGTRVEIKRKTKGGQITLDFYSDEELDNMVNKLRT